MKKTKKAFSLLLCLLFFLGFSLDTQKVKADPATLGIVLGGTALGLGIFNGGLGLFNAIKKVSKNDLNYKGNGNYGMPHGTNCCYPNYQQARMVQTQAPSPQYLPAAFVQRPTMMFSPQALPVAQVAPPMPAIIRPTLPTFAGIPTTAAITPPPMVSRPLQQTAVRQQAFQPVRGLW